MCVFAKCNKSDEPTATTNFMPSTNGSSWTYVTTNLNGGAQGTYTVQATNRDTTVNGRRYRVFTNTIGRNEYQAKSGDDYFQYGRFEAIADNVEVLYLKGAIAAGGSWEDTRNVSIGGVTFPVKFMFTVPEKNVSLTVAGKTYTNVMRVNLVLSVPAVTIPTQNISFYYAEGVGRIQANVHLVIPVANVDTRTRTDLTAYTIAP